MEISPVMSQVREMVVAVGECACKFVMGSGFCADNMNYRRELCSVNIITVQLTNGYIDCFVPRTGAGIKKVRRSDGHFAVVHTSIITTQWGKGESRSSVNIRLVFWSEPFPCSRFICHIQ